MDWSYVAGLFDGEGCVGLSFPKSKNTFWVRMKVYLCVDSDEAILHLSTLFKQNSIAFCEITQVNHLGKVRRLDIFGWESVEKFLQEVAPYVLIKKPQVEIALRACKLRDTSKSKGEHIVSHMTEFDVLRRELHSYAKKGRKVLRDYNQSA